MADLIVSGLDDSTGQNKQAGAGDTLVDNSGNQLIAGNAISLLSTTTSINLLSGGTTTLYTVPSGNSAIITDCILRLTSVTGLTTHGSYLVDSTSNTFLPTTTPNSSFNVVDELWSWSRQAGTTTALSAIWDLAPASAAVRFNVSVSATASALVATAYLFGILI